MKNLHLLKIGSRWLDASINKSNTLTWTPCFTVHQKLFGKKSITYFFHFTFFSPLVNSVAEVMITGTNWAIFFCMSCQKILSWCYCPAIILILTGFCKVWESLLPPSINFFYKFKMRKSFSKCGSVRFFMQFQQQARNDTKILVTPCGISNMAHSQGNITSTKTDIFIPIWRCCM